MRRFYQLIKLTGIATALLLIITACGTQPITSNTQTSTPISARQLLTLNQLASLQEPLRSRSSLKNALLAEKHARAELALASLQLIDFNTTDQNDNALALALAIRLIPQLNSSLSLEDWYALNTPKLSASSDISALKLRFLTTIASAQDNNYAAMLHSLDLSNTSFSTATDNHHLWLQLIQTPLTTLTAIKGLHTKNSTALGWIELAQTFADNGKSVQAQASAIDDWLINWPLHIAATVLPTELTAIQERAYHPLRTAVAILPLSGRLSNAGHAIQSAMMATHMQQAQFAAIHFIDSQSYQDPASLYEAAASLQADVLIGPLNKTKAAQLAALAHRNIAMISLNSFGDINPPAPALQLGLNIEDEARFMAQVNAEENLALPLIITGNATLAARASQAYKDQWLTTQNANTLNVSVSASADFSAAMRGVLNITESKERQTRLENIFIQRMDATPRRRQDISHIYLAVKPADAKALKPLLNYHFAGNLPVYAPSMVFDGARLSETNRDLNGIIFSDTPWAVEAPSPLKQQLLSDIRNGGASSKNLHALGIDAYFIAARATLWSEDHKQIFNGRTGNIIVLPNGETERQPRLAKFSGTKASLLNPAIP